MRTTLVLEPKEYSDGPMQGWRERGGERPPAEILEAVRIGRERLAAREAQRQVGAAGNGRGRAVSRGSTATS